MPHQAPRLQPLRPNLLLALACAVTAACSSPAGAPDQRSPEADLPAAPGDRNGTQHAAIRRANWWHGHVVDADLRPVCGARVMLAGGPGVTTTTDPSGAFAIRIPTGIPTDDLVVEAPGLAPLLWPTKALAAPLILALRPGATLHGRVSAPDAAQADLAETELWLAGSALWPPVTIAVDEQGRFSAPWLAEGIYFLAARLGDAVRADHAPVSLHEAERREVSLAMRTGRPVRLQVVAETGTGPPTPIEGASAMAVSANFIPLTANAETDRNGYTTLGGLPAAPFELRVTAAGFLPWEGRLDAGTARVHLSRGATISGHVHDPNGHPVAGVELRLVHEGSPTAEATAKLPATLARGNLGITRGPIPPLPRWPSAIAPKRITHDTNADGLDFPAGASARPDNIEHAARSDADGHFSLAGLPPGTVRVFARHPAHGPAASPWVVIGGDTAQPPLELTMPDAGTLRVQVTDAEGRPAAEVPLQVAAEYEAVARLAATDAEGVVELAGLAGPCAIAAYAGSPRERSTETVVAGTVEVAIQLPAAGRSLNGRVVDESQQAVAGARLAVTVAGSPAAEVWSQPDGSFSVLDLPAPPYLVSVVHGHYAEGRFAIDSDTDSAVLTLSQGHRVEGTLVEVDSREPLSGVRVRLARLGRSWDTVSDQGLFRFPPLPPGTYTLSTDSKSHARLQMQWEIATGTGPQPGLSLRLQALGQVSGEVVDRLGRLVAGARVAAVSVAGARTRTGPDGDFRLEGLPPGEVRLRARHPEAGSALSNSSYQVRAGEHLPGAVIRLPEIARGSAEDVEQPEANPDANAEPPVVANERPSGPRLFSLPAVVLGFRNGVVITSQTDEGPLRQGDVLTAIDGERVLSVAQARSMLRGRSGSRVRVRIQRNGRSKTVSVTRP